MERSLTRARGPVAARRASAIVALALTLVGCDVIHAIELSERRGEEVQARRSFASAAAGSDSLRAQRASLARLVEAAELRRGVASCAAQTERARVQIARRRLEVRVARARWLLCAARTTPSEPERACLIGLATDPSDELRSCGEQGSPYIPVGSCGAEPPPPPPPEQLADLLGIRDTVSCPVRTGLGYAL